METTLDAPVIESPDNNTPAPVATNDAPAAEPAAAKPSGITILRKGDTPVAPDPTPAADPTPATPTDPATPVVADPTPADPADEEVDFFEYASDRTNGALKDADSIFALYDEVESLRQKSAEKPKIEFPNAGAEAAYNYAIKFPGHEVAAVNNFYRVMALGDPTKLPAKEVQFEAFALKHHTRPREEARRAFDAMYEKTYGNGALDEDEALKWEHGTKTDEAIDAIKKMQEDFNKSVPAPQSTPAPATPTVPAADLAAIRAQAKEAMEHFGGMEYTMVENDPNSKVTIPMDQAEVAQIEEWASNPQSFLTDLGKMCTSGDGKFSYQELTRIMFEFKNIDRIKQQAFESGTKYGRLQQIREVKNTATPRTTATAPATVPNKPASFMDAFRGAVKGKAA